MLKEVTDLKTKIRIAQQKLKPRPRSFAEGYFVEKIGEKAALQAGYSPKSAKQQASRLLTYENVDDYIKLLQEELTERRKSTGDETLEFWARGQRADIKDYFEFGTTEELLDMEISETKDEDGTITKTITKTKTLVPSVRLKEGVDVDGTVISELKLGKDGSVSIKLVDKLKSSELIAKNLGLLIEKQEVSGKDGGPIAVRFIDPKA